MILMVPSSWTGAVTIRHWLSTVTCVCGETSAPHKFYCKETSTSWYNTNLTFIYEFIREGEREGDRQTETQREFPSASLPPKCLQWAGLRPKPGCGNWELNPDLSCGWQEPNTVASQGLRWQESGARLETETSMQGLNSWLNTCSCNADSKASFKHCWLRQPNSHIHKKWINIHLKKSSARDSCWILVMFKTQVDKDWSCHG